MNSRWDNCTFAKNENRIPAEVFRQQFGSEQLSLSYISLLASKHPYYVCREDTFHAGTGRLIHTDKFELMELIDLDTTVPERNQPVRILRQPIFTADYDSLKLEEGVDEADPYAPHPFFNIISEVDITRAKDIAVSYLKEHQDPAACQYAFIRKEGHEVVEPCAEIRSSWQFTVRFTGFPSPEQGFV